MSDPIAGGRLFAIPYQWDSGSPEKNTLLFNHMVEHPMWFASPMTKEEARENVAWMLTNPEWHKWEVWNGGRFAGMLLLSRIQVKVDALFHFTFFPKQVSGVGLIGTRALLWNFLGYAFDAFQLERVSAEVPEHVQPLISFLRQKLAFRYEAEHDSERLARSKTFLRHPEGDGVNAWVAGFGSRRERCHWHDGAWRDLVCLRLLKPEYDARASSGTVPKTTSGPPEPELPGVPQQNRRQSL